jgi:hypothetical protein
MMNMYYKFKTKTLTIGATSAAKRFAREAIDASQWFTFEPLPDGKYEFTVKAVPRGDMTPVWRHCRFGNCPHGLFVAWRLTTVYCSSACRSNDCRVRQGFTLRGTRITGRAAAKYYRTLRETADLRRPAA